MRGTLLLGVTAVFCLASAARAEPVPAAPSAPAATTPAAATPAAPATPAAGAALGLADMRSLIWSKFDYDQNYFSHIVTLKSQGRVYKDMSAEEFSSEVKRAQTNLPVLEALLLQKSAYAKGQALALPKNDESHRVYANLAAMLSMIQHAESGRFKDVLDAGQKVVIKDKKNLGLVRADDSKYYLALYREYFYMMAVANYRLERDGEAVKWLARIEADADVQKLKKDISAEAPKAADPKAERLAALRTLAVAVVPFSAVGPPGDLEWVAGGLPEVLANDLVQHTDLLVVERSHIGSVLKEVGLSQAGITDEAAAKRVGEMLNAGSMVVGSYRRDKQGIWLSMRLVDAKDGRALAATEATVPEADIFPEGRKVLLRLLGGAGWVDDSSGSAILAAYAPKPDTLRDLLKARLLLATKSAQAKELYAKAAKEDPSYAKLFEDLKSEFAGISATLAVMPFVNASGVTADMWMVHGVGQALNSDLPKIGFTVVERTQLLSLIQERQVGQVIDPEAARAMGKQVSADFIVLGSMIHQKPQVRIDARFVDVRSGIVTQTVSAEGSSDDFMAVLLGLSTEIAKRFNEKLSDKTLATLAGKKMSRDEFEKYVRQELSKETLARKMNPHPVGGPPEKPKWPFWSAVGAVGVGAAAGIVGMARYADLRGTTGLTDGLLAFASRKEDQERLVAERNRTASEASAWSGVGIAGAVVAAGGLAYVAYDTVYAKPGEPTGSVGLAARPSFGVGPGLVFTGVQGSF